MSRIKYFINGRIASKLLFFIISSLIWGLNPNNQSIWLGHVRSWWILTIQKPSYEESDHFPRISALFCFDKTLLWFNKTRLWFDKTLLCFDKTLLWFEKTLLWCEKTLLWCEKTLLWCEKILLWCEKKIVYEK